MSEPKYAVGQVVMLTSIKRPQPFQILDRMESDGLWYYAWNKKNFAAEHMVRSLTPEEVGTPVALAVAQMEGK